MNLLFLNSANVWGGNEKWVSMAMAALASEHRVHLAYRHEAVGRNMSLPKTRLPFVGPLDPLTMWRLTRLVDRLAVSVMIPTKPADIITAGVVGRLRRIPTLARLGIVRRLGPYRRFAYETMADGVVVNTDAIKRVLENNGYSRPERIHIVRNGLDSERLDAALKNAAVARPRQWTVTCTANMIERKGFDTLLRGFAHFRSLAGSPEARLVLIGDGERRSALTSLARELGIATSTEFLGRLADPYPPMAASDVFVLCSHNEGMPNALLEAMYLKAAVIVTDVGGIGEIIAHGHNGFLIEPDDWRAVGQYLVTLFKDPHLAHEMQTRAHETVRHAFSARRMGQELGDVCSGLAASWRR